MKVIEIYSFQTLMNMLTSDAWEVESEDDGNFIFTQNIYLNGRKK